MTQKDSPMTMVLFNFGHFLGLAAFVAALAVELALFARRVDGRTARKLAMADLVYGLAAALVIATGLLKVFAGDKPAVYYGHNALFHIKLTLFVVIFLMSIYPTVHFIRSRRAADGDIVEYPALVGRLLKIEIVATVLLPLLAVMMSRGFGVGH
jgi:putative membrane protein